MPVRLAGSTVGRATLHNIDIINEKDIRIGDRYCAEGRRYNTRLWNLLRKKTGNEVKFKCLKIVPCGSKVIRGGERLPIGVLVKLFGTRFRNIIHFASRNAMNIEGLGKR